MRIVIAVGMVTFSQCKQGPARLLSTRAEGAAVRTYGSALGSRALSPIPYLGVVYVFLCHRRIQLFLPVP